RQTKRPARIGVGLILSEKYKIRRRRRTCADDGDTSREILRQIVCEELCSECAICRKILSKGFPKGEIDALGEAVRGCCAFCSVSSSRHAAPSISGRPLTMQKAAVAGATRVFRGLPRDSLHLCHGTKPCWLSAFGRASALAWP